MVTDVNGKGLSRNDFLKTTYNRKVRISYDRLVLILKDNMDGLSSPIKFVEYILGIVVSLMGTTVTITTADFSPDLEWLKSICICICFLSALFYVYVFIHYLCVRITPEDFIYRVEKDNELDEDNHIKKRV